MKRYLSIRSDNNVFMKVLLLPGLSMLFALHLSGQSVFPAPAKGFTSWKPAATWEDALLTGNGTMGAMVMGEPHEETVILSHAALYLPQERSDKQIDQASRLPEIRRLLMEGRYADAASIPAQLRKDQGYTDERDPFIPAFDLRILQGSSNITAYQRSVDYETGEAIVDWKEDAGTFRRKIFVSRADSLVVISIKGSGKINCRLQLEHRPVLWDQWGMVNAHVSKMESAAVSGQLLRFTAAFRIKNPGSVQGYHGIARVFAPNGNTRADDNGIVVKDADEVVVLLRILPDSGSSREVGSPAEGPVNLLQAFSCNYDSLLARHNTIHAALFNKVSLTLGSDPAYDRLHAEESLLQPGAAYNTGRIQRAFDAGRYNIICASGYNPPNLQGIWSGTWAAPWSSGMTHDGNLATAVSMNLPCNTPSLLLPFFAYHERLLNDYRKGAMALFGCRGIHIPGHTTSTGTDTDFGPKWCLTLWTAGAGWVADYFWQYYQYTIDKNFLRDRAYPFMKEAALFYEDFLYPGPDGRLIFNPSYSPENDPLNTGSQAVINATMDIMVARQLLSNCIRAAKILGTDAAKVKLWSSMLNRLPAYQTDDEGMLREWTWKGLQENPPHRHSSQLYALYDETAPEFRTDTVLRSAAKKVIAQKMKFRNGDGGGEMAFGLVQLGASAAHLGDGATAARLVDWLASLYWSRGMGSFHNVRGLFNTDISGGLPYLVSQMLVYSSEGEIQVLPALPAEWKTGKVSGLLLRGNITMPVLQWSGDTVYISLVSPISQQVRLLFPFPVTGEHVKAGSSSMDVKLVAGKTFTATFKRNQQK